LFKATVSASPISVSEFARSKSLGNSPESATLTPAGTSTSLQAWARVFLWTPGQNSTKRVSVSTRITSILAHVLPVLIPEADINLYVYNNFDAFLDRYLYWYDRMVGHSVVLTLLTRTGKSDRHTGPTGRAESLTLGQLKVRSCQRTWRRIRTQSLRDGGLPSRQCLSVVVTNIDEDTKFLCFPRSHYELVKLHRTLEAILESDTIKEVKNKIVCEKRESLGQILVTPPLFHVRLQLHHHYSPPIMIRLNKDPSKMTPTTLPTMPLSW